MLYSISQDVSVFSQLAFQVLKKSLPSLQSVNVPEENFAWLAKYDTGETNLKQLVMDFFGPILIF